MSAYAGPIPRFVVPRLARPRYRSVTLSNSRWYGMIRWALPLISSLELSIPRSPSACISSRSTRGLTTTPSAITGVTCGYRIPEGTSWSFSRCPPATIVWPALFPPW